DRQELLRRTSEGTAGHLSDAAMLIQNYVKFAPRDDKLPTRFHLKFPKACTRWDVRGWGHDGVGGGVPGTVLMLELVQSRPAMTRNLTAPEGIEETPGHPIGAFPTTLDGLAVERVEEELVHLPPRVALHRVLFATK